MAEKTPISDMPSMVPDRDDIRQRTRSTPPTSKKPPEPQKTSGPSPAIWIGLTLITGAAVVYLALQQYSLSQQLASYEERLELADDRIVQLERALTETDESVAMNGTAINAQFKAIKAETDMQMSEIRKLWDVANKRNREWIETNQANLAEQTKQVTALNAQIAALESSQASDVERIAELSRQVEQQRDSLSGLTDQWQTLDAEQKQLAEQLQPLVESDVDDQILSLTLAQENLLAEQARMANANAAAAAEIKTLSEQMSAVDANRLETSRRLTALSTQLESLDARLTSLTGSATQ